LLVQAYRVDSPLLAVGLQYKFRSLQWLSTVPPIFFVVGFKVYINRVFLPAFQFYMPTEDEIRLAKVHSERADNRSNRLEKRFGHPALVTELFTPMLHAKMMPLLSEVYHGKLGRDEAMLNEYGGQKLEAQVVPGGIKIAAVSQVCSFHVISGAH
jgi:calcium permeable stress-gated cation channel